MISINSHLCVRCRKAPLISQPNELREKISYPLVCAPVQLIYSVFYLTFVEKKIIYGVYTYFFLSSMYMPTTKPNTWSCRKCQPNSILKLVPPVQQVMLLVFILFSFCSFHRNLQQKFINVPQLKMCRLCLLGKPE